VSTPFENEALAVLREAAGDARKNGFPPTAGFGEKLARVVRRAYQAGSEHTAEVIAEAYALSLGEEAETGSRDDHILVQAINESVPPGHPLLS
jgi:hypothetical protein